MYKSNTQASRVRGTIGKIQQTDIPSFKSRTPFSFVCNAVNQHQGWTPTSLFNRKKITSMGKLEFVIINVSTENFDYVLELVEEWTEGKIAVQLHFPVTKIRPKVGDRASHRFYGLDIESCYLPSGKWWQATSELREKVRSFFEDDATVTVM